MKKKRTIGKNGMFRKIDFGNRIHEFDFLKGLAVIYMICNHILFDFGIAFYSSFIDTPLEGFSLFARSVHMSDLSRALTIVLCAGTFIGVSGALSVIGKKTLREGIFLAVVAAAITAVSRAADGIMNTRLTIWFGILHLLAACMLLSPLLKKIPLPALPFASVALFASGLLLKRFVVVNDPVFTVFNCRYYGFFSADYYPILPYIGFYLAGIFVGKCFYTDKTGKFPVFGKKIFRPVNFLGGYSFLVYVIHQPVVYAVVWGLSLILG